MASHAYLIREVDVAPRLVAGVRAVVPRGQVGRFFGACLAQVYAAARTGAVQLDGQNIFIYRAATAADLTVDFCVGAASPFEAQGAVLPLTTPSGRAVVTEHEGDYDGLPAANDAIRAWCRAEGRSTAGPSWEIYGHWHDDPSLLRTHLYWLLT